MLSLCVFDVSSLVYRGSAGNRERWYGLPTGGMKYLMDRVALSIAERDSVVLCFDSPTFRKDIFPGYKADRSYNPDVHWQISKLYDALGTCGIKCEKYDGYEADDIIEWAVDEHCEKYNQTVIYSNDMDICHSVRNGVTLSTLSQDKNDITPVTFEYGIEKGVRIPYNTVSAYKTFCGCHSDKIPAFTSEKGLSGSKLFSIWCEFASKVGPLSSRDVGPNVELIKVFVEKLNLLTDADRETLRQRIVLVYPSERPEGVKIEPVRAASINKEAFQKFCELYGLRSALKCLGIRAYQLTETDKKRLYDEARMLKTGEYAADKNIDLVSSHSSQVLSIDSFTKGFTG